MAKKRPKKKVSKAELKSARRIAQLAADAPVEVAPTEPVVQEKRPVVLAKTMVIRDFAVRLNVPIGKVMAELVKNGIVATLNDSIDFDTAAIVADELGFVAQLAEEKELKRSSQELASGEMFPRPPVVTIMGHVDHGKTSLLDAIRRTDVASSESGGITQHIGAYQVEVEQPRVEAKSPAGRTGRDKRKAIRVKRTITFLDTPGHEAFAALRAHGANLTDIVILVVAATEGVRPQTLEALSHARAANVPVIVALSKIDLPEANLDRVKKELAEHDLIAEEWGGRTIIVPVSAKTGENLDRLLEMVLLVADLADLKAENFGPASGVVIEAHLEPGLGPIATVLIQRGRLKVGDNVSVGGTFGKIRLMRNWRGETLAEATPSTPVAIAGLKAVAKFGDRFHVTADERAARAGRLPTRTLRRIISRSSQLEEAGERPELPVLIKADVPGSLAAIETALEKLATDEVAARLIHAGIGPVSESDIHLAAAGEARVFAFRVPVQPTAKRLADQHHVTLARYEVIYQLIDEVAKQLSRLLAPEIVEVEEGRLAILKVFRSQGKNHIIGGRVTSGEIKRGGLIRLSRGETLLGEARITSLQREKESVNSVAKGFECGLGLEGSLSSIEVGDELVAFSRQERARALPQN